MPIDDEEKKTPAQIQRESIAVTSSTIEDDEAEEAKKLEEEKEEDEVEDKKEEDKEEAKEDDEDDDESKKEEDDPVKLKKTIERLKRRVSTKASEAKENAKKLADAEAKLAALADEEGKAILTEEDVETRAEQKAEEKRIQKEFMETLDKLETEAKEIDADFPSKVTELGEDYGKIPPIMIDVLGDIPRGGAVLNYLCDNPEEYEKIRTMKPGKMLVKLGEISEKIKPKKPVKEISKVPAPNKPIKTSNNNDSITLTGKEDMQEFVRKRNAQIAAKRAARG